MKKLLLMMLSIMLFMVTTNSAFAGDCKTRDTVNWHATITSAVNVRADCPEGDVVGTVPGGEVVQILEVDRFSEFYLIKTSVGTGFVFSSFLKDINQSPLPGTETYPNSAFIDLNPNHQYYDEIAYMKENGVVKGNPQGEINAEDSINRAELAKILVESTTDDATINSAILAPGTYSDILSGAWYLPYLKIARDLTIMVGDEGKTTVRPGEGVNGAEVAKMITIAFDLDIAPIGGQAWYEPYMIVLDEMGALPFSSPTHSVTRGEMMHVMYIVMTSAEEEVVEDNVREQYFIEPSVEVEMIEGEFYGNVYYTDAEGTRTLIAESETVDNGMAETSFDSIFYTEAFLSPNEKFIAMPAACWEDYCINIYDMDNQDFYWTNIAHAVVGWTSENLLGVMDDCTGDEEEPNFCLDGAYLSVDAETPWDLELQ